MCWFDSYQGATGKWYVLKLLKGGSGPGITDVTQLVDTKLCTAKRKATERDEVKDERDEMRVRRTRL